MTESSPAPEPREPARAVAPSPMAWILGLGAVLVVGYLFRSMAIPFLLAALLAYLLSPVIVWAQGVGMRRSVTVIGLFAGVALVVSLIGTLILPRFRAEGGTLVSNFPQLSGRLEGAIDAATTELGTTYPMVRRFVPAPQEPGWLQRRLEEGMGDVWEIVSHLGATAFMLVLVPIFAFFLLRDGGRVVGSLLDRLHPAHIETSVAMWYEIDRIIGRYLRGLALDAIAVGALAAIGLWIVGVPYPLLLGALTAVLNPLPYLGTVLSVAAAAVAALASGQGIGKVGWVLLVYAVIKILDDLVIAVVTIGGSLHLHPMLVIASILAGEHALGLLGMVLAVPTVTVVKEIARLLLEHRRTLTRSSLPVPASAVAPAQYVC